jgi:hypothetical protein
MYTYRACKHLEILWIYVQDPVFYIFIAVSLLLLVLLIPSACVLLMYIVHRTMCTYSMYIMYVQYIHAFTIRILYVGVAGTYLKGMYCDFFLPFFVKFH